MADVFISYATPDRERARSLAAVVERQLCPVFWDRTMSPGETWDERIERELAGAKAVVVLWSREAVGSRWVRNEAGIGYDRGVLVPAFIERVPPPLRFQHVQAADLSEWDGSEVSPELANLLRSIRSLVEQRATDAGTSGQVGSTRVEPSRSEPQSEVGNRVQRQAAAIATIVVTTLALILATAWVFEPDVRPPALAETPHGLVQESPLPAPSGLIARCERSTDDSIVTMLCRKMHGHFVGYWHGDTYVGRMQFRYALFFVALLNAIVLLVDALRRPGSPLEVLAAVTGRFALGGIFAYGLTWVAIPLEGMLKGNGPLSVPWVVSVGALGGVAAAIFLHVAKPAATR